MSALRMSMTVDQIPNAVIPMAAMFATASVDMRK